MFSFSFYHPIFSRHTVDSFETPAIASTSQQSPQATGAAERLVVTSDSKVSLT